LRTYNPFPVSDLDRPFCHPGAMVLGHVTPMHQLMCMGNSAGPAPGRRWT
jgi:hypothetical protein